MPDLPENAELNPTPADRTNHAAGEAPPPSAIPPDLFSEGMRESPSEPIPLKPAAIPESPADPSPPPRPWWDQSLADLEGVSNEIKVADAPARDSAAPHARPPRGTSRLGLLAMLLGVTACVLCRKSLFPPYPWLNPVWPAAVGLVFVFLAFAAKVFGSRTKPGVPVFAMLLCLAAIGITAYQAGVRHVNSGRTWIDAQVAQVKKYVPSQSPPAVSRPNTAPLNPRLTAPGPAIPFPPPGSASTPSAGPSGAVPNGTSATQPAPSQDDDIGAGTIFDMKHGTGPVTRPGEPSPTAPGPSAPSGDAPPLPPPGTGGATAGSPGPIPGIAPRAPATSDPRVQSALREFQAVESEVRAAEQQFRSAYVGDKANHPDYLAAEAQVQAADESVTDAKRRSDGYGQTRIEATNRRKEAQEKLSQIVNEAMSHDAKVQAARQQLADAEARLRAAYQAAPAGR